MNARTRKVITVDDEILARRCAQGRVVIIDDDPEILLALGGLLEFEGFAVQSHASAQDFLAAQANALPQFPGPVCLLCDVNMPTLSGLELQHALLEQDQFPFLLMSGVSGATEVVSAFRAGAVDFLIKPVSVDTLLGAVAAALRVSTQRQKHRSQQAELSNRAKTLSERESMVVRRVARGMTNQAIAQEAQIALRTVKLYRQKGMEKLGVTTTADLVRIVDLLGP
jgi:FixJ family two-component response regulator